jgi:hypothetical protein
MIKWKGQNHLGFRVQTIATSGSYQTIYDNLFAGYNSWRTSIEAIVSNIEGVKGVDNKKITKKTQMEFFNGNQWTSKYG